MDNKEEIKNLRSEFDQSLNKVSNISELDQLRISYLGKKGSIQKLNKLMSLISQEERKELGKLLNDLKEYITNNLDNLRQQLELDKVNKKLEEERIDITLPSTKFLMGSPHMLEKIIEEIEEIFITMGYDVVEGPEVEKDLYNFEMLNLPKGHPARDVQDTFYIDDEMLLRSQTSPVQVRTMLANKEKTSIRILCPGKTYRRDTDDATHSHQFMQLEGLIVDKKISLADLKGTFDVLVKKLFGEDIKIRFRPSFYPFTEPSVELDMLCFNCKGKGCHICKNTGWITIGGAGIVHPNVLSMSGYNPDQYIGFAFGMGIERMAMLKYGISDIRTFYVNDLRSIKQFDLKDGA